MEKIKKVLAFIAVFATLVGAVGGFGYCIYTNECVIAACIVILAAMAVPEINKLFKFLKS